MISVEQALKIHTIAIERFGGLDGIKDQGSLESALARPFQSYGGVDLYESVYQKAAAIGESIIINHPFLDGNKRTGYLLMEALLRVHDIRIKALDEELYNFVISIATGEIHYEEIVVWLQKNCETMNHQG